MNKFAVLLIAVLVVAGLWAGGWFFAAGEVRSAVGNLAQADGETNPKLTCAELDVSGFPFRFDISCTDAILVSGDLTTKAAGARASVRVYAPTHAVFSLLGPITFADAFSGAQSRLDFTGAEGSVRLEAADFMRGLSGEGWRLARASLVADGVNWTDTLMGDTPIMSASHVEAHVVDVPERHDAAQRLAALAAYATLNEANVPALAIDGGEASLEAELTGLPDDLRAFSDPGIVNRWREAGGEFKLVSLRGTAGDDFIETTGTLALDADARLDGMVNVKSRGLVERTGTLLPEELKNVILGAPAEDGSYSQTLNVKAGVVFSGLLPIMMVPPLQ